MGSSYDRRQAQRVNREDRDLHDGGCRTRLAATRRDRCEKPSQIPASPERAPESGLLQAAQVPMNLVWASSFVSRLSTGKVGSERGPE
jgi:hypothetical protein